MANWSAGRTNIFRIYGNTLATPTQPLTTACADMNTGKETKKSEKNKQGSKHRRLRNHSAKTTSTCTVDTLAEWGIHMSVCVCVSARRVGTSLQCCHDQSCGVVVVAAGLPTARVLATATKAGPMQ